MDTEGMSAGVTRQAASTADIGLGELRGAPEFEVIGVDRMPEPERTSTPWTFSGILLGSSLPLALLVYGWLPITFGLSVASALTSATAGTLVGTVLILPMIVIGSDTATNNSTASGAHFGVRGRLVGSFVGLATMLVYTALGIWTGGQLMVSILARLVGTPNSSGALAIAYAVIAAGVALIAIYGYHLMARAEYLLLGLSVVTYVLMFLAFSGKIDMSYSGGGYLLGSFWKTWIFSGVVIGVAGPLSLITVMGDWTRYISPTRFPARKLLPIAAAAIFIALMVPIIFGVLLTSAFQHPMKDFFSNLVSQSPGWNVVALAPLAVLGTIGFVVTNVYSAALDLDAIVPRLSRAQAAVLGAAASTALVYLGSLVWNVTNSVTAASFILVAIGAPWAAITSAGYIRCRGRYHLDDLQVFNRGLTGGRYWFAHGFNSRAVVAWLAGSTYGVLAIDASPLYTGPFANIAGGVDTSFMGSFMIGLVIYLAAEVLLPHNRPSAVLTGAVLAGAVVAETADE